MSGMTMIFLGVLILMALVFVYFVLSNMNKNLKESLSVQHEARLMLREWMKREGQD